MSNIVFREDGTIMVKNVVVSYPHLFAPYGRDGESKKYSGKFLLRKDTHKAEIVALNKKLTELAVGKWQFKLPQAQFFLKDGEAFAKNEGDENYFIISASESTRPSVIDADKTAIYPEEADEKMYPGTVVNLLIRPWMQDNTYGKKINANLLAVQRVRDGERLAASRAIDTDSVFEDVSGAFGGETDDGFGG
jgi:hypothetical protein